MRHSLELVTLTVDAAGRDAAEAVGERDLMLTAFAALSENDREVLSLIAGKASTPGAPRGSRAVRPPR
jgi:hypothetical protein